MHDAHFPFFAYGTMLTFKINVVFGIFSFLLRRHVIVPFGVEEFTWELTCFCWYISF